MQNRPFHERIEGRYAGMVNLKAVENLYGIIENHDDWYLLEPGETLPDQTVSGSEARQHMGKLVEEILAAEKNVWSTMIYVKGSPEPEIIKVFHPKRAGCGCGPGSSGIKPWWVFSRITPEPVPDWESPESCNLSDDNADKNNGRGGWIHNLLARGKKS